MSCHALYTFGCAVDGHVLEGQWVIASRATRFVLYNDYFYHGTTIHFIILMSTGKEEFARPPEHRAAPPVSTMLYLLGSPALLWFGESQTY
jgi:hypothetical protein